MIAIGMPQGLELLFIAIFLLVPIVAVLLLIRLSRQRKRDIGFPVEPNDPTPPKG